LSHHKEEILFSFFLFLLYVMLRSKLSSLRSSALAKHFSPTQVESGWPDLWTRAVQEKQLDHLNRPRFSMILPPPNVTGELHVGHALTVSIQDAVIRRKRMSGHDVMWLPGLDHAGIATQAVVERALQKERLTRVQLGREQFVERVWQWKRDYGHRITDQMRRLGASLDWHREFFSLDDARTRAVDHAFVTLFDDGLVFRADRLVMWCVALQTVISDIEVDSDELSGRTLLRTPSMRASDPPVEFGVIHDVAYQLADNVRTANGADSLVVSTTRPETLFADAALAVHPDDPRYASLPQNARVVIRSLAHSFRWCAIRFSSTPPLAPASSK
jgi:valyl-tRNA synthetase